jgi:hypothetical protein
MPTICWARLAMGESLVLPVMAASSIRISLPHTKHSHDSLYLIKWVRNSPAHAIDKVPDSNDRWRWWNELAPAPRLTQTCTHYLLDEMPKRQHSHTRHELDTNTHIHTRNTPWHHYFQQSPPNHDMVTLSSQQRVLLFDVSQQCLLLFLLRTVTRHVSVLPTVKATTSVVA